MWRCGRPFFPSGFPIYLAEYKKSELEKGSLGDGSQIIYVTRFMVCASENWFDGGDEVHQYAMQSQVRNSCSDFINDDADCFRLFFSVDMLTDGVISMIMMALL